MSLVSDAADALMAALKTVEGVRYHDLSTNIDPPALVIGIPRLTFETYSPGTITAATFPVFLIVAMDDRAQRKLWDLVGPVAAAIEAETNATITTADPGWYPAGAQELPSYTFTTEMSMR